MSRFLKNIPFALWYFISTFIVVSIVIFIFGYIFIKGAPAINLQFIVDSPKGTPLGMEGGILPAILGSLALVLIACISSAILGISTAIYLCFYCNKESIITLVHLIVSCIAGIPSIVLGLFGYSFLVYFCNFGVSLISGGITLGIMIFPYIEVIAEKSIREVDKDLIFSSYALGVDKCYTFFHIILPSCKGEILSGIIMSGGFAMGAAAPVMLTSAVVSAPNPDSLFSPVMALPYHLYILVSQGISFEKAYGTALVLIIIVIILNFTAALLVEKRRD
ncbi:phosphate ABC transporter permease PstA [Clostridium magnum]|uniref:Phosphate transport system permease protein PstA n=1 Tax=Clostridium magnum DSM 2767 TaxID=1121326 RepID=A0A162T4Y4_9CLOT|nr:phosphate ABC transporter permease PstA [Clostridium magnum]KZL92249.1 phosphate transport system permease protein PstA [Clostridium magnum DSM 2767]SHH16250.1 phosphate ABC transporter membrane protein 2, PhoT family (TC 3.A.1.7.1) [Clostridium magnum DSM 2767]